MVERWQSEADDNNEVNNNNEKKLKTKIFKITAITVLCSEKVMAPHSSTLAWKIPWTEKPGRLQYPPALSRWVHFF